MGWYVPRLAGMKLSVTAWAGTCHVLQYEVVSHDSTMCEALTVRKTCEKSNCIEELII